MNILSRETWNRGDTIAIVMDEIKDVNGTLVTDFSSWLFHATLKADRADTDAAAIAKLETADFATSGSKATAYLETESLGLTLDTDYFLDVQIVDGSGYVTTTIERILVFQRDVTRRIVDT